MARNREPIIFSDFDGTITEIDVTDQILAQLAHPSWQEIEQEWVRGTIGSRECLERQLALVSASEQELQALIDAIPVDPGFPEFYRYVRKRGVPFYILSDGFDYVIRRVLRRAGVKGKLKAKRDFFASVLEWADGRLVTSFPHADSDCRHGCATCKAAVMKRVKNNGPKIFIGDGLSDRFGAEGADIVFAKGQLLAYCRDRGLKYRPFETFADVQSGLEELLAARTSGPARRKLAGHRALATS